MHQAERHHLKSRGSGGSDDDYNIMPLCRNHHIEIHKIGRNTFISKYKLSNYMERKGWEYISVLKRWFPPEEHM
jgi:hypothetical protein